MKQFVFSGLPSRVVFGNGSFASLRAEVERLEAKRALVLCTPSQRDQAEQAAQLLGDMSAGVYDGAVMHVPVESAEVARAEARERDADCCVAVGGGSTIGLAKAIALTSTLPIVAVPTTYAGSEMTPIWGLTEGGVKKTGRDSRVRPKTVVYDPELTVSLPASVSGPSGLNAIAHCVEAIYAQDANPITDLMAEEGIRALALSLPRLVSDPADLDARSDALYGAWLAGAVLGAVGMAIHHKLCHTLGGSFDLPHADVHTVIIPHAAAYNASAAAHAMARIARAMNSDDAPGALFDLATAVGAKTALKDIGMRHEDLDRAAELAVTNPYFNPKPITREGVRCLLENAYQGNRPRS